MVPCSLQVKGPWSTESTHYGYDYWYQPRHNVMISSQWGSPKAFCEVLLLVCNYTHLLHYISVQFVKPYDHMLFSSLTSGSLRLAT